MNQSQQTLTYVAVSALKPHPKNHEYFDDVSGEDYERLKKSIQLDGIQAPIIVAADMTIISGHQRYRVAKELDLPEVSVIIRSDIKSEDDKLRNLISANFGRLKNDPAKQRKAVAKYVELVGFKHGEVGRNHEFQNSQNENSEKLTLDQIAKQLGISKANLTRLLSLERFLTDSMKELVDDGVIGETLAADIITRMTEEEQDRLVKSLDATKRYTAKELQPYIDKVAKLEKAAKNPPEKSDAEKNLEARLEKAKEELGELKKTAEDIDDLKQRLADAEQTIKEYEAQSEQYDSLDPFDGKNNTKGLAYLEVTIQKMLDEDLSPLKFSQLIDTINESPTDHRIICNLVDKVSEWCRDINAIIRVDNIR